MRHGKLWVLPCALLAGVLLLFYPENAKADPVLWFNLDLNYNRLEFGSEVEYAHFNDGGFDPSWAEIYLGDWTGTPLSGEFELVSGPLVSVEPNGDDLTYIYAAGGTIRLTLDFLLPSGVMHHGQFVGSLGQLTINPDYPGFGGSMEGSIGPGLLDRRTAALLHMNRHTQSGDLTRYLDTSDSPDEPDRVVAAFGEMAIYGTVPEPSMLVLLGIAAVGLVRRARGPRR